MAKNSKTVICKICGFVFECLLTVKEFDGCYTPSYCEQKNERKANRDISCKTSEGA